MKESRLKTDVKVSCQSCGADVGYVVKDGHKEWLCESCGDGKMVAVNVKDD